jgi:hypothetical protein
MPSETPQTLPSIPKVTQIIRDNIKQIAADVATTAASIGAVLTVILSLTNTVHLPDNVTAIIVTASTVVATVAQEARRIAGEKKAAKARLAAAIKASEEK